MLEHLRSASSWRSMARGYLFQLWAVKLAGFLPEMHVCLGCGDWLEDPEHPSRRFSVASAPVCIATIAAARCDLSSNWEMSPESRTIAQEILPSPIGQLTERTWTQSTAADLRRFLAQQIESHIERKLVTVPVLEAAA